MMTATAYATGAFAQTPFPRVLAVAAQRNALAEYGLDRVGFDVKLATDIQAALHAIAHWGPEAIVLESLPGFDSRSLIATLRRITDMPILTICDDCGTEHKVLALTLGADDHIAKPFNVQELEAHIRARLRRPRMESRDVVTYADMTIDVSKRRVGRGGIPIELSSREFDLLLALARHPEQVFTRSQLLDLVWGIDREVTLATVETYVSYLRSKIDIAGAPRLIQTMRGVGYTMRVEG